jgi:hypothetical protein
MDALLAKYWERTSLHKKNLAAIQMAGFSIFLHLSLYFNDLPPDLVSGSLIQISIFGIGLFRKEIIQSFGPSLTLKNQGVFSPLPRSQLVLSGCLGLKENLNYPYLLKPAGTFHPITSSLYIQLQPCQTDPKWKFYFA